MSIAMALAVLPSILIMIYIYKKDHIEKEPIRMILRLVFGGVFSALPALSMEGLGTNLQDIFMVPGTTPYNLISSFVVVAFSEELVKFIFLYCISWRSYHFNCMFDAVVYAVCASLGFATLENIFYVLENGLGVAIMRAITSVPGHTMFAIFMGINYGKAKVYAEYSSDNKWLLHATNAVIVPTLIHGFYDFCLFQGTGAYVIVFCIFLILLYIAAFRTVNKYSKSDMHI